MTKIKAQSSKPLPDSVLCTLVYLYITATLYYLLPYPWFDVWLWLTLLPACLVRGYKVVIRECTKID